MDNADAMKALKTASDLAAVGGANLEATTNALGAAWRSGIAGAQDFGTAAATVNAIIGAGNMKMEDFVSALSSGILPGCEDVRPVAEAGRRGDGRDDRRGYPRAARRYPAADVPVAARRTVHSRPRRT